MQKEKGYLYSDDITGKLAALQLRKATVNGNVKTTQSSLSGLTGEDRRLAVKKLNGLLAEQAQLAGRIKEYSILHHGAIDQIMLRLLKERNSSMYFELLAQAKRIYDEN